MNTLRINNYDRFIKFKLTNKINKWTNAIVIDHHKYDDHQHDKHND
jgi:hypothetical protein